MTTLYEWMTCRHPIKMNLHVLTPWTHGVKPKWTSRKVRLITLATLDRVNREKIKDKLKDLEDWVDPFDKKVQMYIELNQGYDFLLLNQSDMLSLCTTFTKSIPHRDAYCNIVRDVLGDPFSPLTFDPRLAAEGTEARELARQIYEDRWYEGMPVLIDNLLDNGLEESVVCPACKGSGEWVEDFNEGDGVGRRIIECGRCRGHKRVVHPVVSHVRTPHCPICWAADFDGGGDSDLLKNYHSCVPSPHVRGCWALDLILGRS